jgi:beta-lactamase regulating signal transducer with metallopeptidase domain
MDFAALQHSVFLQALGIAILNSLWQVFIIWLFYETICVSYKNASAKFKNNLGTIFLFVSFILFLYDFVSKILIHQTGILITTAAANITELPPVQPSSAFQQFLSYAVKSLPYLSVAYIFLLFFLMAKLFTAYRYVYIISNNRLLTPPGELQAFANKVSGQMEITRKIRVWISQHIDVPATIGFIKPVILIPFASLNNLSADQLEAIILHELSHIKRNDYLINITIAVIETILFFNPFVVLLSKVIKRERENCCDDFVLQYQYDPHSYASALLRLEQSRASNLKLAIGAVSGKKQLLSRIKRITNGHVASSQFNYGQKLTALLLVTAIICSVAWLSPAEKTSLANNILRKDIQIKKLTPKDFSDEVISLPNAAKEYLTAKILKHNSHKKESDPFKKLDTIGFLVEKNDKENLNEELFTGYNNEAPLAINLKEPKFFFDESKLQLSQFINLKNFPFPDTKFNIDLSKIDIGKFNENLKQAYKEINNINWDKVQNDIRESFSRMKAPNFPSKEQTKFFIEKVKEFSKISAGKQNFGTRYMMKKLNKEIQLQDSLNSKAMIFVYNNGTRIQREYQKRVHDQYAQDLMDNSNFNYSTKKSSIEDSEDNSMVCVNGNNNPSSPENKNIKILVTHSPKPKDHINQKKFLQFSFDNNTKKPGRENVIRVEVSDLP